MMSVMQMLLVAVGMALVVPIVDAGIYKWVDADGVTHYGESSPENTPASEVEIEPPLAPEMTEEAQRRLRQSEQDYRSRSRSLEQARQRKQADDAAREEAARLRRERCGHALVQLRVLDKAQPVYRDEEGDFHTQKSAHSAGYTGKRRYLDDAARALEQAHFRKVVEENCGDDETADRHWLEVRIAAYHRQQCRAARDLLIELKRRGDLEERDEILLELDRDIDRHCIAAKLR